MRQCIGCGHCCITAPCAVACRVHGKALTKCPELKWNGSRHMCNLMTLDGDQGFGYRKELSAGAGCCSGLNDWRREPLKDRTVKELLSKDLQTDIPEIMQVFVAQLGNVFITGDQIWLILNSMGRELIEMGYTKKDVESIKTSLKHYMTNYQPSYQKEFMG